MKINFQIRDIIVDELLYVQKKNWVITVLIFLIVFILAMLVWRDCILDPQPGETTLNNILKIEQEYKDKMKAIKKNHQVLSDQSERFNNPEDTLEERNYFEPSELTSSGTNTYNPSIKSTNPKLVP